jgi:hypothetical protein
MKPFERAQATKELVNDLLEIDIYKKLSIEKLIDISLNIQKIYFLDSIETRLINLEDAILHNKKYK